MMSSLHGTTTADGEEEMAMQRSKNFDIEAHPTELAIIVKYGPRKEQKIIYLKDLTASVDASVVSRFVLDKCPIIPLNKAPEIEQIIHYLQKRNPNSSSSSVSTNLSSNGNLDSIKTTTNVASLTSKMEDIESYIELLYEENEKTKGTAYILSLSCKPANLQHLIDNEVLMAALTRVFREDSKKNFELATNIAVVFLRLSYVRPLQPVLSHYKIGALSMQLIENELKRWEIWKNEAKTAQDKAKKKWEFAIHRQDGLVSVLLQILQNLADDLRVENKMVKRGILPILIKCLDHGTPALIVSAVTFLWKLSVFAENKDAMILQNIIEKLVPLFPTNNIDLSNALYSLLFNLSFDQNLRIKMVANSLVPFIAPAIETNSTALCLLYQLSIIDDAKAMITFTDAISSLMKMLNSKDNNLIVKGLLINVALEKRNSQLISSSDGRGLDIIINKAFESTDVLLMKICRNIASHDGATQDLFQKHLSKLLQLAIAEGDDPKSKAFPFAIECLGTAAQINSGDWPNLLEELNLISWIESHLEVANANTPALPQIPDDFLLQIIILCGAIALNSDSSRSLIKLVPQMTKLILRKQSDDEIVLQIVYCFYCLLCHAELTTELCSTEGGFVEYLINLMHDSNPQLRNMCDQALQFIAESSPYWNKRLNEERFRFHNSQWLEMCEGQEEGVSDSEESDNEFNNVILGTDELLLNDHETL